jgi:hypothetical protein
MLTGLRSYHDWQRCEVLLQLLEWLICLLSPDRGSGLLQQLEEWESPLCQSRDKLAEHGQASLELLNILGVGWHLHLFDCLDLLLVGLNYSMQN